MSGATGHWPSGNEDKPEDGGPTGGAFAAMWQWWRGDDYDGCDLCKAERCEHEDSEQTTYDTCKSSVTCSLSELSVDEFEFRDSIECLIESLRDEQGNVPQWARKAADAIGIKSNDLELEPADGENAPNKMQQRVKLASDACDWWTLVEKQPRDRNYTSKALIEIGIQPGDPPAAKLWMEKSRAVEFQTSEHNFFGNEYNFVGNVKKLVQRFESAAN